MICVLIQSVLVTVIIHVLAACQIFYSILVSSSHRIFHLYQYFLKCGTNHGETGSECPSCFRAPMASLLVMTSGGDFLLGACTLVEF